MTTAAVIAIDTCDIKKVQKLAELVSFTAPLLCIETEYKSLLMYAIETCQDTEVVKCVIRNSKHCGWVINSIQCRADAATLAEYIVDTKKITIGDINKAIQIDNIVGLVAMLKKNEVTKCMIHVALQSGQSRSMKVLLERWDISKFDSADLIRYETNVTALPALHVMCLNRVNALNIPVTILERLYCDVFDRDTQMRLFELIEIRPDWLLYVPNARFVIVWMSKLAKQACQ